MKGSLPLLVFDSAGFGRTVPDTWSHHDDSIPDFDFIDDQPAAARSGTALPAVRPSGGDHGDGGGAEGDHGGECPGA
jgi:hypothetical protein